MVSTVLLIIAKAAQKSIRMNLLGKSGEKSMTKSVTNHRSIGLFNVRNQEEKKIGTIKIVKVK